MAAMMGHKFGIVTISPEAAFDMEENILKCGLSARATPIRPSLSSPKEQMLAIADASPEIEPFTEVSRQLIADGAEIILPGCMVMSPVMRIC